MIERKPDATDPLSILTKRWVVGIINLNVKIASETVGHKLWAVGANTILRLNGIEEKQRQKDDP